MNKEFKSDELYVWADSKGEIRGQSIEPFHHGQIKAVKQDRMLYKLLALCDALRVGKAWEKKNCERRIKKEIANMSYPINVNCLYNHIKYEVR